jgi:uncharacterized NAD(P)/FAD-binding protein YdhS
LPDQEVLVEIAVIGLGSWGLSFLERIVTLSRSQWGPVRVHVVEPGTPGSGVYAVNQPDYLILNTPCGQVSLYPWHDDGPSPRYAVGLYEWVTAAGYRWVGDSCLVGSSGRGITPDDYLPRRLMGEYLQWFYATLVASAPSKVEIVHHHTEATNILSLGAERERVLLANGESLDVDHIILTSGHTDNVEPPAGMALVPRPYPVDRYTRTIPGGAVVAVEGMGLVATDVVIALTVGRGGSFAETGDRLRYTASGDEPALRLFSRSGFPYCSKAVATVDESDEFRAVVCTKEAIGAIQGGQATGQPRRQIDFRSSVLPLILAEMQVRYFAQSTLLTRGRAASEEVATHLGRAWHDGSYETEVDSLAGRYGEFDPRVHFFGPRSDYVSSKDYESQIYSLVETDLCESLRGGSGPVKSAYEVLRHLRDLMRTVIEFRGLTLDSYLDFRDHIKTRVNRIVAGPPAIRSKQLLALIDADIVAMPFGPSPSVEPAGTAGFVLSSSHLEHTHSEQVDWLIHGHLENPTVSRSASALLTNLWHDGRLQPLSYGTTEVGSVALDEEFHPTNASGEPARRIWLFGSLTEGVRYFTHYVPSPKSRLRAFLDAQHCVEKIMA